MKILVTGGAGYIGSTTVAQFIEAGHEVTVYDSLEHGYRAAIPAEAEFIQADLADEATLKATFDTHSFEAIVHFAAYIEAGESMKDPGLFFRNNVVNTLRLIEQAVAHHVNKFIFSGSAAVYAIQDRPLIEADPLDPLNAYGETKLMIERILYWFHQIYGLRYAVLRYFNAAGATETRGEAHQPESHLIPNILLVPLGKRDKIKIFGTDYPTPDGTCVRDYIHIHDLALAHRLVLEALAERETMTYNVGNGKGFSIREVIEVARAVTGHPIPAEEAPRRPGDPAILVANATRIEQELGWQPRYKSLEEIIGSAWKWHQTHPTGYPETLP
jgi:UDP-glucose 4-epimerase